ncbi:sulfotransferase domain-containing protein [Polynucleobacter paneuropaeus]|nr:sulfotransferase domain-containing protein [Polynucleobacter paneuropaeus]MBT8530966.1 sulfotransferase domain-containing protein [Polynucleobacter paneuropaeus]MBT8602477.1 sulfotransferase domain-containing protein [Polynucleobacter paneuropaeus]MBT8624430.1 sulfotransferase domain-containing protein [Polynucleobacter paneuropaeus]QWD41166.1 sulfotransferase domain-containing protein [Polynucleobacter paneuropaeus]
MAMLLARLFFDGNVDAVPSIHSNQKNMYISKSDVMCYKSHKYYPEDMNSSSFLNMFDHSFADDDIEYLYLKRHPLDVFLSMLNWIFNERLNNLFIGGDCKSVKAIIADKELEFYFGAYLVFNTLVPEFVDAGRWDFNVLEWENLQKSKKNITILRYEDLVENPAETLAPFFSKYGVSNEELISALAEVERDSEDGGKFFWNKTSGTYKKMLPPDLIEIYYSKYKDTLAKIGY